MPAVPSYELVNIYIYIYIYTPSRLSPQFLCGISCNWVHDVQLHSPGSNECSMQRCKDWNLNDHER